MKLWFQLSFCQQLCNTVLGVLKNTSRKKAEMLKSRALEHMEKSLLWGMLLGYLQSCFARIPGLPRWVWSQSSLQVGIRLHNNCFNQMVKNLMIMQIVSCCIVCLSQSKNTDKQDLQEELSQERQAQAGCHLPAVCLYIFSCSVEEKVKH